jgi:hypothetical protein
VGNEKRSDNAEAAVMPIEAEITGDTREAADEAMLPPDPVKETRKPGELYFLILLIIMTGALFVNSFKLPGIVNGKLSSPSSVPQVMLISMLVFLVIISVSLFKEKYKEGCLREIGKYLLNKDAIILLIAVVVYAFILPLLHFAAASMIFLWGTMFFLDRKKPWHKLLVSGGTLVCIILIFNYIMKVVLP